MHLHIDDEPETRADLTGLLATPRLKAHLYYCGPPGFMDAIRTATVGWREGTVHYEAFQRAYDENFVPQPFSLKLRSTGQVLEVPADASALTVLREAGVPLSASCESGVCGTCECGYIDGEPIHLDAVLSPDAQRNRFIPCVSRAKDLLTLDL
ncbi:iron-sulfur cluster-binding domain-containing protein [Ochrobactrum vermis]|uniref:Iron-sulfur cluster-binding domain-containing protein n=1 Tax=Ochrobactrum vermis TaxID=1827297 RepID=A0ABU8PKY7_9HYPH|nr:iron-sulfur cluster-binding domain-containing protein [Ochrobactrum vermis]